MSLANTAQCHQLYWSDQSGSEKLIIVSARDFSKEITGNATCHTHGNHIIEILGDTTLSESDGTCIFNAEQYIKIQCGDSEIYISPDEIRLSASVIKFKLNNERPAASIAVQGSSHTCPISGLNPHVGGPLISGSNNVFIAGKPAARVGDKAQCQGIVDYLIDGHPNLLINGKPTVCKGSKTQHGGQVVDGVDSVVMS